ncbi:MAG: SpoIIIAH-like family protein [Anaerotignaceae bacterium]
MFGVRKNQVVVTALVVMVAVAGYLNFTTVDSAQISATIDEGYSYEALIDDSADITVFADDYEEEMVAEVTEGETMDPLTAEYTSPTDDTGAAIFVNATADQTAYFVQAKLDREQSRAKQKDMLTEMINNENLDNDQKSDFAKSMLTLQQRIEKETAAETMIKSKGFSEAYVRIDDDTVDVVVSSNELSQAQVAQIEDIVKRKTGMAADKIRISTIKAK